MTLVLMKFLSMKILPAIKNTYLLKPIKKEKICIGNICGLTREDPSQKQWKWCSHYNPNRRRPVSYQVIFFMIQASWDYPVVVSYYYVCFWHSHCLQMLVLWHHLLYHLTQMAVNDQCAVCNLHTGCKMMCTICKNWIHSKCCYVTHDNFAMCLPCNHNCFLLVKFPILSCWMFPSTTKITPTTFNENCRNDVKKTWKVVNEIISTKAKKAK